MSSPAVIEKMIEQMENKLEETRDSIEWNHGPVRDAVKIVIPMMEDNIKILKAILEAL